MKKMTIKKQNEQREHLKKFNESVYKFLNTEEGYSLGGGLFIEEAGVIALAKQLKDQKKMNEKSFKRILKLKYTFQQSTKLAMLVMVEVDKMRWSH